MQQQDSKTEKNIKKNKYKDTIIEFIKTHYEVSPKEIIEGTNISQQTVHNNLKKLIEQNLVTKKGSNTDVFYSLARTEIPNVGDFDVEQFLSAGKTLIIELENINLSELQQSVRYKQLNKFIDDNYLYISPDGNLFEGVRGFIEWANRINPKITLKEGIKMMFEYAQTMQKYRQYFGSNNLINATKKFVSSFQNYSKLDGVYYCDFYSIERFGKTKLGNYMLYGKQSQNKILIQKACEIVKKLIADFIKDNQIDAVAFVPPTIDRQLQFMDELSNSLNLDLPIIKLKKVINQVAVQQKTIKTAQDRITNAENIVVNMSQSYQNILIIDDAVGSGSTFAVVAKKLRLKKIATGSIFAIAMVGSANGVINNETKKFEVVNEV
jgi:Fe2+ or Zn2+ uptake regulation protein/adenine/guanine phosphoribosyltransferase-like PRPP-binding protein